MQDCVERVPFSMRDEDDDDEFQLDASDCLPVDPDDPRLTEDVLQTDPDLVAFGFGGALRVFLGADGFVSIALTE
jgi:hypothetical protein